RSSRSTSWSTPPSRPKSARSSNTSRKERSSGTWSTLACSKRRSVSADSRDQVRREVGDRMRSMTGHGLGASPFASADGSPRGSIEVELRTVNHRFLDVRVRVPRELVDLSPLFEQLARESLSRGRVDISVRADLLPTARPVLDRARAKAAYLELVALRDEV